MKQIRRGVFETNSSSTHAINIYCANQYNVPKSFNVRPGEFGWENETYYYPEDKVSYLYTLILKKCVSYVYNEVTESYENRYDYEKLNSYQKRIKDALKDAGVEEVSFTDYADSSYYYVDHSENITEDDIDNILDNWFDDFVFNPDSVIITGNDNCDIDVSEDSNAAFSLYKGN